MSVFFFKNSGLIKQLSMISRFRRKHRWCDSTIFCSESMARNSLTKIRLWGHHLMWVSSAAAPSHMAHIHPLCLTTSSIFLGELFLQPCGDPNRGTGEAEQSPLFLLHQFSAWWLCQDRSLGGRATEGTSGRGWGKKRNSISCGLLNLAWIPFCPNGWGDTAPAFPSWFCIPLICISKVKSSLCPHRTCPCLLSPPLARGWLPLPRSVRWALQLCFPYYISVGSSAHSFFFLCHRNNLVLPGETKGILQSEKKNQVIPLHSQKRNFVQKATCYLE